MDEQRLGPDRNRFLERVLACTLLQLDELVEKFRPKAKAGDAAAGSLLVQIAELRAGLTMNLST